MDEGLVYLSSEVQKQGEGGMGMEMPNINVNVTVILTTIVLVDFCQPSPSSTTSFKSLFIFKLAVKYLGLGE